MTNKMLVWNCRGVRNQAFLVHVKLIVDNVKPNLVALLENKSPSTKAKDVSRYLGFSKFVTSDGRGLVRGI